MAPDGRDAEPPGPGDGTPEPGVRSEVSGGNFYGPVFMGGEFEGVKVGSQAVQPPGSGPAPRHDQDDQHDELTETTELTDATEKFADAVRNRWKVEKKRRWVEHPDPGLLPVRWTVAHTLMDHWANVHGTPDDDTAGPVDLEQHPGDIATTYGRVPSGRLVVLGEAGSGKTVLGLRLVLDLLQLRAHGDPVPEIFSLGSWDPRAETLAEWLRDRLSRDTPGMDTMTREGTTVAEALIEKGLVLPVLDGFDEMADGLEADALDQLSRFPGHLVLTSRTGPYAAAIGDTGGPTRGPTRGLKRAAAIELTALTPADAKKFLTLGSAPAVEPEWDQVLARLRDAPSTRTGKSLREALTTPLMISLARDVYGERASTGDENRNGNGNGDGSEHGGPPRSPRDLLRFRSRKAVEEHLLSSFVPSAYRRRAGDPDAPPRGWTSQRAQRWLGYLAAHLDGRRDLAWWEIGTSIGLPARTAVISFLAALSFAVTTAVGNLPVDLLGTSHGLGFAIRRGLVVGTLHGLVFGLVLGYVYRRADSSTGDLLRPRPVRVHFFRRDREPDKAFSHKVVGGTLLGFFIALAIVLVDRLLLPPLALDDGLGGNLVSAAEFPLTVGLSAGAAMAVIAWLETPITWQTSVSCADLLRQSRANVVSHLLVWALVVGLVAGLGATFTEPPLRSLQLGLVFGIEGAFCAGLAYGLCLTAWGQWVALARIWLPLTGRLPWRLVAFLEDACERDVLRRSGAVYQFRHARLQDHLAGYGPSAPGAGVSPPRRSSPGARATAPSWSRPRPR
ncbi:hypothetical protein P2Q00_35950 [Streptomyces coacervatus]|uniref:NACHT domain-containing protein n=1 Tax=Streptomyces coacervatus TaxID=647381 RepID=UPI0023DC9E3D|nr:NACHT domain-containing protein [Streptomyces coacervatus]MDF2270784.1 hypothetical protein [Streptomyces coacervatus]